MYDISALIEMWIAAAAGILGIAGVCLCAVWAIRARRAVARVRGPGLESLRMRLAPPSVDAVEAGRPRRGRGWKIPAPSFLNPRRFTVSKVAALDAIHATWLAWICTEQGARVLASAVRRIPDELVQAGTVLRAGLEQTGHLMQSAEQLFQAALPAGLWDWLSGSRIIELAHAVEQKVDLLDAGHNLHFVPDSAPADFDLGLHFPWLTAIVSSTREVRLVSRGDTTLGRALSHVLMDVVAVSVGAAAGGVAAGGFVAALTALDVVTTGGFFTLCSVLLGAGGAVAGATVAKKVRFRKLEMLSEKFARSLRESAAPLKGTRQDGQTRLAEIKGNFEQRQQRLVSEIAGVWRGQLDDLAAEWGSLERSLHGRAVTAVRAALTDSGVRLQKAEDGCARRRFILWWPSRTNVRLWIERRLLRQAVHALTVADQRLSECTPTNATMALEIVEEAAASDPLTTVGPLLTSVAGAVESLNHRRERIVKRCRAMADARFAALEREREAAAAAVLRAVADKSESILVKLRSIETELRNEARALGGSYG